CQWSNHLTPACSAPTPFIVNISPNDPAPLQGTITWTSVRDPLINFVIRWGLNPGGPYNDSHSPLSVAANLRSAVITVDGPDVNYFIVTAVDSDTCQATSI